MKVYHLLANHKFTGPADPALVLARALKDRGVDVTFFPGQPRDGSPSGVEAIARERDLRVNRSLTLSKHARPVATLRDVAALRELCERDRPDVVHCHTANDHLIATLALRRRRIPIVRTLYDDRSPRGFRARTTFARVSRVWAFSDDAVRSFERWPTVAPRVRRGEPVLDIERFPGHRDPSFREAWGVPGDALTIGVVARMQTHRLFPELIAGFAQVAESRPRLHLVILGRGTNQRTVAHEPARATAVADRIHFPGYLDPTDYPRALGSFDALLFLVPGSDGTCRAAREALVSGVPVISSRRGLLPAIVEAGVSGLDIDEETPAAIGAAIARLHDDPALRETLATGARGTRERFDARRQAQVVLDDYQTLIEGAMSEDPRELGREYDALYRRSPFGDAPGFYRWIIRQLDGPPGTILDIGCGTGGALQAIVAGGGTAWGLDLSREALARAHRRCPTARLVLGDGTRLPFEDGTFRTVLNLGNLEHFADVEAGVREMRRVLAPGGRAYVLLPNLYYSGTLWQVIRHGTGPDHHQPIDRFATRREWRDLLDAGGLRVIHDRPYHKGKWWKRLLPANLAWHFLYVAEPGEPSGRVALPPLMRRRPPVE